MKKHYLWLMATTLLISACAKPAEDPTAVANKYWKLIQSGNTKAAERLVATKSRQAFESSIKNLKSVQHFELKNSRTSITTILNPSSVNPALNQPFNTILVLEQGQWKIDATQTQMPPDRAAEKQLQQKRADDFSKSMRNNLDSINESMHEGIQLLNEALRDGSKDMSNSLLKGMQELNRSMKKSIEQLKRRKQQDQQPSPPTSPGSTNGEGMI